MRGIPALALPSNEANAAAAPRALMGQLLDDAQLGPRAGLAGTGGRRRSLALVLEQHALPRLARVDAENRRDRDAHVLGDAAEARGELDPFVAQLEALGRLPADVQRDAAVAHEGTRHLGRGAAGVDNEVRRLVVRGHPLVHRAHQVGPPWGWRRSHGIRRSWRARRRHFTSFQYSL